MQYKRSIKILFVCKDPGLLLAKKVTEEVLCVLVVDDDNFMVVPEFT